MGTATPFRHRGILEKRREDVRRVDAMTVKVTRVEGRVLIKNAGEARVEVPFSVVFCERPFFNFGGEMDTNFRVTAGSYPTVSAVVEEWTVVGESDAAEGRYNGCTLAVVTTGQDDQQMWLHYSFEGKAIRNPLNGIDSVDDTL